LPLQPGEEALDDPTPVVAAQSSAILSLALFAVGAVRRNHLNALFSKLLIEPIAVVRAIADQIVWFRFDHVEVKAQLHQRDFMVMAACVLTANGRP